MKIRFAVTTHFDSHSGMVYERGLDPKRVARTVARQDWWESRADILRRFVMPSLACQSFQDFDFWALTRKENAKLERPVMQAIKSFSGSVGRTIYVTPHGPTAIRATYADKCDVLGIIFLDSDDMYGREAFAQFAAISPTPGRLAYFTRGYIYGLTDRKLGEYDADTATPPFYCTFYWNKALRSGGTWDYYRSRWNLSLFHNQLRSAVNGERIAGRHFCYSVHGGNTTTAWKNPHTASKISRWITDPAERAVVLRKFGVAE